MGDLVSVYDGSVVRKGVRVPCDCWNPLPDLFYAHCVHRERHDPVTAEDIEAAREQLTKSGWTNVYQIDERTFIGTCPDRH